jgi:hypothetical protein
MELTILKLISSYVKEREREKLVRLREKNERERGGLKKSLKQKKRA